MKIVILTDCLFHSFIHSFLDTVKAKFHWSVRSIEPGQRLVLS